MAATRFRAAVVLAFAALTAVAVACASVLVDPKAFAHDLAAAINRLGRDPELRERMGKAGRRRVVEHFSWDAIAQRTVEMYRSLL
jgi:glycosyltransferase involved in cell wall biosynthesis